MPGYPPVREGDWACTEEGCKASNFARRTECFKCGAERDFKAWKKQKQKEIGGSEAKKSGGLFSAEDWRCNKCGNINWARRNTCNMCNAPKVEDDERTGFGGGFNDRQDVEYVDRDSSGDEIDDFGRKKKKFRSLNDDDKPRKEVLTPGFDGQNREADDDDDDDDDEEDASKYNLDDDSEEEPEPKKESSKRSVSETNSRKRRASSSSSSSSASSSSSSSSNQSRSRSKGPKKSSSRSESRSRKSRSNDKRKSRKRSHSRESRPRSRSRSSSRRRSSSREKAKSSSKHSSKRSKSGKRSR